MALYYPPVRLPRPRNLAAFALATGVILAFGPRWVLAQGNNQLLIEGGTVTLIISTATPGAGPVSVQSSASLLKWGQPAAKTSKITVSTSCPGQSFTLTIQAISPTRGVSTGSINLVHLMSSTNLITGISRNSGSATLRYTASATVTQGDSVAEGLDTHTITFTLLAQ